MNTINEIKMLRARHGLTQARLAQMLGVAIFTVRRWESGATRPSPMAQRLIRELFPEFRKGE